MTKQFNLSDHITNKSHSSGNIPVARVKEFINLLKENLEWNMISDGGYRYKEIIDKLAGSKLI